MTDKSYKNILFFTVLLILTASPVLRGAVRPLTLSPILGVIFFLVFTWLWRMNNHSEHNFNATTLGLPLSLFTSIALVSLFLSIHKLASFYALVVLLGYIGLYYLVVNNFTRSTISKTMMFIVLLGTILSVYGLLQSFDILPHQWWVPSQFMGSTYVNHNHFSGYLELVIPLALGLLLARKNAPFRRKCILLIALVIMVFAFLVAQSRGAWLSLSLSALVVAGVIKWKGLISGKGFLTLFLLVIFIFSVMYFITDATDGLFIFSREGITEASLKTRVDIWGGTLGIIAESPVIGKGIGTFSWAFLPFRPEGFLNTANFAHNDYLQTASEMGLPSFFIFLWIIFIPIRRAFRGKVVSPELAGCAAGILSLAFHGLIDFNFHVPANTIVCVLYAGFIMGGQFFSGEV